MKRALLILVMILTPFLGYGIEAVNNGYLYTEGDHKAVMNALNELELTEAIVVDLMDDVTRLENENSGLRLANDNLANGLERVTRQRNLAVWMLVGAVVGTILGVVL